MLLPYLAKLKLFADLPIWVVLRSCMCSMIAMVHFTAMLDWAGWYFVACTTLSFLDGVGGQGRGDHTSHRENFGASSIKAYRILSISLQMT